MAIQKRWLGVAALTLSSSMWGQNLYRHNNKDVGLKDLSPALRQAHYEAEKAHFDAIKDIAERDAYERNLQSMAKVQNKSPEDIEAKLFNTSASDQDAQKWFDENKHRLGGRDFDKIKEEIKTFLSYRLKEEGRQKVIEDLKAQKKFQLTLSAPKRPEFDIKTANFPQRGPKTAKVHIVEFADYQCPHCQRAAENIHDALKKFPQVKMTFIDYPINHSGISRVIAEGAACAAKQEKFWEYHEEAFEMQKTLSKDSALELAKKVGLDEKTWQTCMQDGHGRKAVEAGEQEAERLGITGTPTIYINGIKVAGYDPQTLEREIKSFL